MKTDTGEMETFSLCFIHSIHIIGFSPWHSRSFLGLRKKKTLKFPYILTGEANKYGHWAWSMSVHLSSYLLCWNPSYHTTLFIPLYGLLLTNENHKVYILYAFQTNKRRSTSSVSNLKSSKHNFIRAMKLQQNVNKSKIKKDFIRNHDRLHCS